MAGYRETFESNVDFARGSGNDMTSRLQNSMRGLASSSSAVGGSLKELMNARRGVTDLANQMQNLRDEIEGATDPEKIKRLTKEFQSVQKAAQNASKTMKQMPFDMLEKGLGRATKGLLSMNASILTIGFDFLISSIKRVYELQERWTKAIGGFNLRIGGMTSGLRGAQKAATSWSGTIRGLTNGDINEGIQLFADFTDAIGRVVERGDDFEKFGLQLARGFNLGGQGAGQLSKVFENIGDNGADAAETMKALVKGANAAHIPTNMLAKDIVDSSTYMARFGKEGQKTFVTGAAYARKYTISMEQLRNSVEGLDMFDEAAKTASKLNTVFGTMINSMDLMLEDDPAKRLEMIRQQFLAQGTTFDKLTPKQRRYLSETLKLTDDQTAALLSSKNAGESYADFQAKAAQKEKNELSAKQMMEKQLRATAQTMYAFGAAFDRVTVAIANAIKPLLEVFGLANDGTKDFKSFGQVMEGITVTVEKFFNSLAKNEKWQMFMRTLATDLRKAGSALKEFVLSGRAADLVGDLADGMKNFYTWVRDIAVSVVPKLRPLIGIFEFLSKHIGLIAAAWAGMKAVNIYRTFSGMASSVGSAVGEAGEATKASRFAGTGKVLGKAAAGVGMGLGAASALGGGETSNVLGAIGGIAGAFVPLVGPLMGPLGALIGKGIEKLFEGPADKALQKSAAALKESMDRLDETNRRVSSTQNLLDSMRNRREAARAASDAQNQQADKLLLSLKGKKINLDTDEQQSVASRIEQLGKYGLAQDMVTKGLGQLQSGALSADVLNAISKAQAAYRQTTDELDIATKKILENEQVKAGLARAELAKQAAEVEKAKIDQEILALENKKKKEMENIQSAPNLRDDSVVGQIFDSVGLGKYSAAKDKNLAIIESNAKYDRMINEKRTEQANKQEKLGKSQLDVLNQQLELERKIQIKTFQGTMDEATRKLSLDAFAKTFRSDIMSQTGLTGAEIDSAISGRPRVALAQGGIVTKPTNALIGENGPEAVIPLRKNYAAPGIGGGSAQVVTSIADIHLDGQKVGRAIVRNMVTGRN